MSLEYRDICSSGTVEARGEDRLAAAILQSESAASSSYKDEEHEQLTIAAQAEPHLAAGNKIFDVCAFIIDSVKTVSLARLQVLVYYSLAWGLVWDDKPLFTDKILAGPNGPLIRSVYDYFKGDGEISASIVGDPANLSVNERDTITVVIEGYKGVSTTDLLRGVRTERPWRESYARREFSEIPLEGIAEYYRSLASQANE